MTNDFYQRALDSALDELSKLQAERDAQQAKIDILDERIDKVRQGALGLTALADIDFNVVRDKYPDLFDDTSDPRVGITQAVREALRSSNDTLLPKEIRDRVFQISPTVAGHKNPLASIHAVLRRLAESNEVILTIDGADRTRYGWIGSDDAAERLKRWFTNGDEVWERIKSRRKKRTQPTIDASSGQSSVDVVLTNPPYATTKKKSTGRMSFRGTTRGGEEPTPSVDSSADFINKGRNSRRKK
jgi:hypothetical protein